MDVDELPSLMSVEDAGEILGLSRSAAYRAASRGEVPTLRFGRNLKVPKWRLLALLGHHVGTDEGHPPGDAADDDTALEHSVDERLR